MMTSCVRLLPLLGVLSLFACGPVGDPLDSQEQYLPGKADLLVDYLNDYLVRDLYFTAPNHLTKDGMFPTVEPTEYNDGSTHEEDPNFHVNAKYFKESGQKILDIYGTPHIFSVGRNLVEFSATGSGFVAGFYLYTRVAKQDPAENIEAPAPWNPEKEGWTQVMATGVEDLFGFPRKKVITSTFNNVVINLQTNEMNFQYFRPDSGFYTSIEPSKLAETDEPREFAIFVVPTKDGGRIKGRYAYSVKLSRQ